MRPRGLGREAKKRGGAGARTFVRPAMRARSPGGAPPPPKVCSRSLARPPRI